MQTKNTLNMLIPLEFINESELSCHKNINDLDDLCIELWQLYFTPRTEPMSAKDRTYLRERYNMAADRRNKLSGQKALVMITPSMQVQARSGQPLMPIGIHKPIDHTIVHEPVPVAGVNGGGIIQQIIAHHIAGKTNKEIIALGFNSSTVGRQVGEYKKKLQKQ